MVESWSAGDAEIARSSEMADAEDRLVLIDRIAGLEAQIAELTAGAARQPSEQLSAEQQILALQSSLAWRLGSALTSPRRVLRRVFGR